MLGNIFVNAGWDQLLNAKFQSSLFRIKLEHLGLHRLPNSQHILRMINTFFRTDVADVDHSLDPFSHLNERAKFSQAHNRALHR